jgi:preprotein translocase subunit Sec61beta
MSGNKDLRRLKTGDEVCLFRKDGLLPITCGLLKYFDEKHDKVCINVDKRSVVLSAHLYDFVGASAANDLGPKESLMQERQQYMQFLGMIKREPKT